MKRVIVIFTLLVIAAGSIPALAEYSGGTGTPEDPYLISTPEDMNQIGRNYTDWDKCFKLTADINLSAYTGTQFSRIGPDDKHAFRGAFDGNGHTISGFTYTAADSDYIGVFGNISAAGRIENVSLIDVNVIGGGSVGGLAGRNEGTISNCNSTGNITGIYAVGGLMGENYNGSISDCYSTAAVTGQYYLGGLVGISGGSITNCYSTGAVIGGDGAQNIGGLLGANHGDVTNCYSTGVVTDGDNSYYLGGLVGWSDDGGNISTCYSTGAVTGGDNSYYIGGLVGHSNGGIINNSTGTITSGDDSLYLSGPVGYAISSNITGCYATGDVAGGNYSQYLGGLVGNGFVISNCYSTGAVTGGDEALYLGGLVGYGGDISNCYSTSTVAGGYDSDYVGGLVGYQYFSDVTDCYVAGDVAGDYDTGGLVGLNDHSTITRCYSSGSVSGYMYVGGLVGWNYEGTTTDSFWDTDTSSQSWSDGGTGKTTAEMMTLSIFTSAGWDFTNIWAICEGMNYPRLLWSIPAADLACPDGVNFVDYSFFAQRWLNTDCASNDNCDGTDFDFSGTVDIADLEIFCKNWLHGL